MTKCDMCADRIDAGLLPTCVAACPMRALDFGRRDELEARYGLAVDVYPLPDGNLTHPSLVVNPHPKAGRKAFIANREEIKPGRKKKP